VASNASTNTAARLNTNSYAGNKQDFFPPFHHSSRRTSGGKPIRSEQPG
jgi:hypothetical protein